MEEALRRNPGVRQLAGTWWLLALAALAVSTLCAVLLVAARASLLDDFAPSPGLFREALVMHVNLAVVVWFLACAAGLWSLLSEATGRWRFAAPLLSACGATGMALAPLSGEALPVLANYVPILDHRGFLAGLTGFVAGIVLQGAISLNEVLRKGRLTRLAIWQYGVVLSIVAAAMALAALLASLRTIGLPDSPAHFEMLAWAPGHVLQFVHMLLLMIAWTVLGTRSLKAEIAPQRWLLGLLTLAAIPTLTTLLIFVWYPVSSPEFRHAFTLLMAFGAWPAAALLATFLLGKLARADRSVWAVADSVPLLLSLLLFVLGCLLGTAIRGESTMVPAHYHGTVGAVTLAYMALGYRLLPVFGFRLVSGRLVRWQPIIYGTGLMLLAGALGWSGWLGMPRKTLPVEMAVQTAAAHAAMGVAGLGGLLAISGAALYVFNILRGLFKGNHPGSMPVPSA